jgi:hypothetical protein
LYQVDYIDPETQNEYSFITNDSSLRPGSVAYLYKVRRKIEKSFDVLKNKLFEKKAWATSDSSKKMQASIISFVYNLMLFLELVIQENISGKLKTEKKREKDLEARKSKISGENLKIPNYEFNLPHIFQMMQQFVRSIRNWLARKITFKRALHILIERLRLYI